MIVKTKKREKYAGIALSEEDERERGRSTVSYAHVHLGNFMLDRLLDLQHMVFSVKNYDSSGQIMRRRGVFRTRCFERPQ
jgi:hypothetical protein